MEAKPNELTDLIWYAIPGGLVVLAWGALHPTLLPNNEAIAALASFVIGYVLHQLTRLVFECSGFGYNGRRRPVLREISRILKVRSTRDASAIWHLAFHNPLFPDELRSHDRRMWHFVLALWTLTLAGMIAGLASFICCLNASSFGLGESLLTVVLWPIAGASFVLGLRIYSDVSREEIALIRRRFDYFGSFVDQCPWEDASNNLKT